jgi:hypothetical protein
MVAIFVMSLVLLIALSISSVAMQSADKNNTETGMTGSSRLAMDEALYQIRGAKQVLAASPITGLSGTTGASQIVLAAPGYNPAVTSFYLDNITDYVVLRYDTTSKKLFQSLVPGTGSVRPLRTNYVLASNVSSCAFSYRVRDYFTSGAKNNAQFTLKAVPLSRPVMYVNGVQTDSFNISGQTVTISLTSKSNDIQFVYSINPATAGTTLEFVGEVEIALNLLAKDSRQADRTLTLQGAARLRNNRK